MSPTKTLESTKPKHTAAPSKLNQLPKRKPKRKKRKRASPGSGGFGGATGRGRCRSKAYRASIVASKTKSHGRRLRACEGEGARSSLPAKSYRLAHTHTRARTHASTPRYSTHIAYSKTKTGVSTCVVVAYVKVTWHATAANQYRGDVGCVR